MLYALGLSLVAPSMTQLSLAQDSATEKDRVVAVINGREYTESLLRRRLAPVLERPGYSLEAQYPNLLEQFLLEELINQAALNAGYDTDARVQEQVARAKFSLVNRFCLEDQFAATINEETLMEAYQAQVDSTEAVTEIRARHILLKTAKKAKEIITQLDDSADFAGLAKKHSTGPSSAQGGDLGYFAKGQMVPSFETAAFALKQGEYTATPVESQFGFHVIYLEDQREKPKPTFAALRTELLAELQNKAVQEFVERLTAEADIQRFDLNGNALGAPAQ
ncbi:MAG: peptidylprolyl isomerase [Alphaproteobacteria bacterium]|nr:peptidylprolyl isomerase [Alphaproteobacteria bacterium]